MSNELRDSPSKHSKLLEEVASSGLGAQNTERAGHLVVQIAETMRSLTFAESVEVAGIMSLFVTLGEIKPCDEVERMLAA